MANYCRFDICAKGPEKDLKEFLNLFRPDQEYTSLSRNIRELKKKDDDEDFQEIIEKIEDKWSVYKNKNLSFVRLHKAMIRIYDEIYPDIENILYERDDLHMEILKTLFVKTLDMESEEDYLNPPSEPHLLRILYSSADKEDGKIYISGDCMRSVRSSMFSDGGYYEKDKENIPENIYKGTTLDIWLKNHPGMTVEVISQEDNMCFSERYVFEKGRLKTEKTKPLHVFYCDGPKEMDMLTEDSKYSDYRHIFENFMEEYEVLSDKDKENAFPVFIDGEHPSYLSMDENFKNHGHYDPEFSI